jgi:hypothetical protein
VSVQNPHEHFVRIFLGEKSHAGGVRYFCHANRIKSNREVKLILLAMEKMEFKKLLKRGIIFSSFLNS